MDIVMCDNRCWCKKCNAEILEGQDYFRYNYSGGGYSSRLNICYKCIIEMGKTLGKKVKYFEKLAKMPSKERKMKVKMTSALIGDEK